MEGAALLGASVIGYDAIDASWWIFALMFLVPDAAMAGYGLGTRTGATLYNIAHTTALPLALFAGCVMLRDQTSMAAALIWLAHIGFDRAVGYGLKYGDDFHHTHLGAPFAASRSAGRRDANG
jgi:hypothetical protein